MSDTYDGRSMTPKADSGAVKFEPDSDWNAEMAIVQGLVAKRNGQPINEQEFRLAAMVLAAQAFMQAGVSAVDAMDQVDNLINNGATIKASLNKHGELEVTIESDEILPPIDGST